MKSLLNNIILIVFNTGERRVFTIPMGKNPKEGYFEILNFESYKKSEIKKWYSFGRTQFTPEQYELYWSDQKDELDQVSMSVDFKVEEFKKQRSRFMPVLDLEFMKSLEEDCVPCKQHVVQIKNFLRDGPNIIGKFLDSLAPEDDSEGARDALIEKIVTFNCFNNIFDVFVKDAGSGYESSPKITVELPQGKYLGMPLKAVATIENGSVSGCFTTQIGSGYLNAPIISVSPPEDPNGKTAKIIASPPENDIIENVSWRETRFTNNNVEN